VTITPSGDVYAVALAVTPSGPFPSDTAVLVIKGSITGGMLSWDTSSLTTLIHNQVPAGLDPIDQSNDKEMVIADPTDSTGKTVYVVWDQIDFPSDSASFNAFHGFAFRENVFFTRTTNGGATWSPARDLTNFMANRSAFGNQIVVQPDGTLVDVFTLANGSGNQPPQADQNVVGVMRSTDHAPPGPPSPPARPSKRCPSPTRTRAPRTQGAQGPGEQQGDDPTLAFGHVGHWRSPSVFHGAVSGEVPRGDESGRRTIRIVTAPRRVAIGQSSKP
jgi:hypothetical protein